MNVPDVRPLSANGGLVVLWKFPVFLILLGCALGRTAAAKVEVDSNGPSAPLDRQVLKLRGDPARPVILQVNMVMPDGVGPFPLVIFNHGSDGIPEIQSLYNHDQHAGIYYFLSRGYAVASPMLRGYGGSGGQQSSHYGCRLDATARDNAKDILAVVDQLPKVPRIDTRRIIVAGASYGGWNALAVGGMRDSRVKAVVNFYGGVRASMCEDGDAALSRGARIFGKTSRVPSLWLYGENDSLFPRPLWEAMHRAYIIGGGLAEIPLLGTFQKDAHGFLGASSSLDLFAAKLDAFLSRTGFSTETVYPEYIPQLPPPPSHYAAIEDVDAVPFLNSEQREGYRKFLKAPQPRAFFIVRTSGTLATDSGYDPLGRGYALCKQKKLACRLYAVNDDVVWTYPKPPPPATRFAAFEDATAIPYLDAKGRDAYDAYRRMPRPKAFVIAPNGVWRYASGDMDAVAAAMTSCATAHPACKPYAVDGHVVWPGTSATIPKDRFIPPTPARAATP